MIDRIRLNRRLAAWFKRHARSLPWRRTRDPFAIWVSEVMLQQTQVVTVIPYFERFLQSFPDVRTLALANESEVLRHWEGLGYYRRARALHRAAQILVDNYDGTIPNDPLLLAELPGLGRYTVNAILSQAFDRRLPIIEANSRRVLCRLLGEEEDPRRPDVDKRLWNLVETLLPRRDVGQFNQALMELGALVCTARQPACERCPLAGSCVAHRLGKQDEIPRRADPPVIEEVNELALVIRKNNKVLLVQRPADGRWGGMWEFPHLPLDAEETHEDAAPRLLDSLGIKADRLTELLTVRHAVTRFRITLRCLAARHRGGKLRTDLFPRAEWILPEALPDYPLSSPQRKLAHAVLHQSAPSPPVLGGRGLG